MLFAYFHLYAEKCTRTIYYTTIMECFYLSFTNDSYNPSKSFRVIIKNVQ